MIRNERQLKTTKKKLREFEAVLGDLSKDYRISKSLKLKMQIDALESDISILGSEIKEFGHLKSGTVKVITAKSFHELPEVIIKARIARSMTQKDLALSLGMKEQQIQRYESNNFASVSFSKIEKIVEALGITIEEKARLNKA
jgi:HTH-type transcriptional regulator/antitoxin HigA